MNSFPRQLRLRRRRAFQAVFSRRCSVADPELVIYIAPNGLEVTRLGLSVGRKVGGAVARSRIRRLIREAFRLGGFAARGGYDIICVPRPGGARELSAYRRSLERLLPRAMDKWRRRAGRGYDAPPSESPATPQAKGP